MNTYRRDTKFMSSGKTSILLLLILSFFFQQSVYGHTPKNVLLITVDTLRADHLSCYGYPFPTSPNIDNLSKEGVLFLSSRTPIPTTSPAHATLMTSLYPQNHNVIMNLAPMDENITTLAEVLKENGYTTAAVVSAWPLKKEGSGLEKGFDFYEDSFKNYYRGVQAEQFADKATNKAINWLHKNKEKKFFLWVHYFDPHFPYYEHADLHNLLFKVKKKEEKKSLSKTEDIIYRYDREIAFADFYIGRLLDVIKKWNLESDTIIIFTADHGESLGEHDYTGHGKYLYEPSLYIPLIIKHPEKILEGKIIKREVSLLDIMPTILDFLGIPTKIILLGESLVPLITGNDQEKYNRLHYFISFKTDLANIPILSNVKRSQFAKSFPERIALLKDNIKVIYSANDNTLEMYNIKSDPPEIENLANKNDELSKKLTSELILWFNKTKSSGYTKNKYLLLKEKDIKVLKSLGYIN
jgi:arylsulfatase A-like enzyme